MTDHPDARPPAAPLFRAQALQQLGPRHYGTVLLSGGGQRLLSAVLLAIVLLIVLFFASFSTTRKVQGSGALQPADGGIRIWPQQAGVVRRILVREGATVAAGDVLFVLSNERSTADAAESQRQIAELLKRERDSYTAEIGQAGRQARQRDAGLRERLAAIEVELGRVDGQITLQQQRIVLSKQTAQRYAELVAARYVGNAQLQDKEVDVIEQSQRLADLQRARGSAERDKLALQGELSNLRLQAERDALALARNAGASQQSLTEHESRREVLVRAPQAGVMSTITVESGQPVEPKSVLGSLLPLHRRLEAEIFLPSRAIGFIRPGMTVLLRYQAYPYQKFGQYRAEVSEVTEAPLRSDDLALRGQALPAAALAEPLYRVRLRLRDQALTLYGKQVPLKPGMLVDASIVLDRRRLYEWVLEPLFTITGRI